jgi:uncharacterized protein YndB with AHSA1/START domain
MKELIRTYKIHAHPADVWAALTECEKIEEWGGGPCDMSPEENFEFSLWGGEIYGKNIEVVPERRLAQEWFAGNWEKPSIVTFEVKETSRGCELHLTHKDIPDNEFSEIDSGWDKHYVGPLKELVEANAKDL